MSIRLNKAIRELNIGLQTAVDFLQSKPEIGEIKSDPSFKLNDRQYAALSEVFKREGDVKEKTEELFRSQKYTPLGKIDLSGIGTRRVDKSYRDDITADHEQEEIEEAPQHVVNFYFDNTDMIVLTTESAPAQITDVYGICVAEGDSIEDAINRLESSAKQNFKDANLILGLRLAIKDIGKTLAYGTAARMETD